MENIKRLVEDNRHLVPSHFTPTLEVGLVGQSMSKFSTADVQAVFSVFGSVGGVEFKDRKAIVRFQDKSAAFFAQKFLDNKYISAFQTTLKIA